MNHFAIERVSLIDSLPSLLTSCRWFRSLVGELEQKRKGEKRGCGVEATEQLGLNGLDTGQSGREVGVCVWVNSAKNSGGSWTRKVYTLWSQEPLCIYVLFDSSAVQRQGCFESFGALLPVISSCFPSSGHTVELNFLGPCGCGDRMAYFWPMN